jgi:hypothetical protein
MKFLKETEEESRRNREIFKKSYDMAMIIFGD